MNDHFCFRLRMSKMYGMLLMSNWTRPDAVKQEDV